MRESLGKRVDWFSVGKQSELPTGRLFLDVDFPSVSSPDNSSLSAVLSIERHMTGTCEDAGREPGAGFPPALRRPG